MTERFYSPVIKYTTSTLKTLPGALLYFYETGTSTPKTTWGDPDRSTANAHPVQALADGTFPPIFINGVYRVELKNAAGVTQPGWPVDDVGAPAAGFPFQSWSSTYSYSEDDLVTYNGVFYQSLDDDNVGNTPSTSPLFWQKKLFLDAPSAESYLNGNSDGTYTWHTIAQTKSNLSLPTDTVSDLALKAPIESPIFTGNPRVPTPDADDNDTSIASTAFVQTELLDRPQIIDSIADLRLPRAATNNQKFCVTSYNSGWAASLKPPVGGGMFTYVATDTTSAEDYGHIIVGADGKRYYRDGVENVSLHDFGALGAGANEDTAIGRAITKFLSLGSGVFGDQYPATAQLPLYVPAGRFKVASFTEIVFTGTGQEIYGEGATSQLDGIGIDIIQNRCRVRDLFLRGAGGYGIRVNGDTNNIRDGIINNITVRDRNYNIVLQGNNGNFIFTNLQSEKAVFDGIRIDDTLGCEFNGGHSQRNVRYGCSIFKAGEVKMNGFVLSSNEDYGLYINAADSSNQVVECYFTDVTITVNQTNTANRDSFAITAAADNGAGGTTLTIGSHSLAEDMTGAVVTGTTDYNGDHTVFNVTNTTVDIAVAFVSNQTGTLTRPEWDVYAIASTSLTHVNDLFFDGGNINQMQLVRVYNATFSGTRLKEQAFLQSGCNRILSIRNGRGRRGSGFKDVDFTGQNTGWAEMFYSDNSGGTAAGNGSAVVRVPDSSVALIGNSVQRFNESSVSESSAYLSARGMTFTVDSTGASGVPYYTGRVVSLADDAAHSFTPPVSAGWILITNGAGQNARGAQSFFSTATPAMSDGGYLGAAMARTTGVLSGTTGADTFVTISAHTDGKIYIENRSGGSQTFYWTILR